MSFQSKYETIQVTPENFDELKARGLPFTKIGDSVRLFVPATKVDLRPFAQWFEDRGMPYPDEP